MAESQLIHLAADISFLHTDYLWRMPGSWVGYPYYGTSEFYEDIARIAERGVMDMLFFGDTGGTSEDYGGNHEAVVRYGAKWPRHDMTPMIPLMSRAAQGVGFAHDACRRPITIRFTARASSTRSTMSPTGASPGTP